MLIITYKIHCFQQKDKTEAVCLSWIGWVVIGVLGIIALNVIALGLMYINYEIENRKRRNHWR